MVQTASYRVRTPFSMRAMAADSGLLDASDRNYYPNLLIGI